MINIKEVIEELKRRDQKLNDFAEFLNNSYDFRMKIRRGIVHQAVADYFNLKLNNYLIADIKKSLQKIKVIPIVVQHNRYYRHKEWLKKRKIFE